MAAFKGVKRRFQLKGSVNGIAVVEDYAHHPTEIRAALETARSLNPRRLVAVFQPHLFSRTKFFCDDFGRVLSVADRVVITKIYGTSREKPMAGVTAMNVVKAARASGHSAVVYIDDMNEIPAALAVELQPGDMVLFLGAGTIGQVSDALVAALREPGGN